MPNMFDMLAGAQDGKGIDLLARQFDLSRQQTELAIDALLPAFSQSLKRSVADPYGVAAFMNTLASGAHGNYFENAAQAFSPGGVAAGNDLLGQLFGSKDLSRAIAAQAAQATGIGADVLKRMLPAIASMLMGGMLKQSTGQAQAGPSGAFGAGNPLGQVIEEMMRRSTGTAASPEAQASPDPFGNPFGKVLQDMFGGPKSPERASSSPYGDNPFGRIFEDMMGGGTASKTDLGPGSDPASSGTATNPSGRPRNTYDDLFGDMFETGRKTRDDYQKGVENIFEQFKAGMDRNR